ncbi:MAG: hypothetical protein R3E94_03925 [Burkholderiaceae bacterium]
MKLSNSLSICKHLLFGLCGFLIYPLILLLAIFLRSPESFEFWVYSLSSVGLSLVVIFGFVRVVGLLLLYFRWFVAVLLGVIISLVAPLIYADVLTDLLISISPFDRAHIASGTLRFLVWCLLLLSFQPWLIELLARRDN